MHLNCDCFRKFNHIILTIASWLRLKYFFLASAKSAFKKKIKLAGFKPKFRSDFVSSYRIKTCLNFCHAFRREVMPLQFFYFKSMCRTSKCVRGLTSRGDHWGEDQQARYPHLERHPEPISPDDVVSSNWFRRWSEMTELVSSFSVASMWNRKWWGAAVPGDTQRHTYINFSPTHEHTL